MEGLRESYGGDASEGSRTDLDAEEFAHLAHRMGPTKSIRA